MAFDAYAIFGILLIILSGLGFSFLLGKKLSQKSFEVKGHEAVEKHLIRQAEQLKKVSTKYEKLKKKLANSGMDVSDITNSGLRYFDSEDAEVTKPSKTGDSGEAA